MHFFDSDDWIEPDFYSHLLNVADNFDLVVCGYKVDNEISFIERRCISGDLDNVKKNNLFSLVSLYLVVDIAYQIVVPMMLEVVDNTIEVPLAMEVINGKVPEVLFSY